MEYPTHAQVHVVLGRGQQRYSKTVTSLHVITFGLFSERNFKK